ncbi:hypothetical protein HOK68_04180 [Candidatus Woesearchaeota archaeon]|jgi:hypothetical protein|nr:hypothetical protein [Candidatus Woesearchaeota archaeon]MBT4387299.1 hypothetical protein [Candidatus Woesearchaeota archaeon]MBT4595438.1 hypothetical protein [Candidatus Woesearchaeota archaeon]MBT5741153.1 hypothetical protein [Candidatus Woesearchaeota archaeon]MBT6505948.1 hypothetical protein [Candidatus Woesearchaeota archaeon]
MKFTKRLILLVLILFISVLYGCTETTSENTNIEAQKRFVGGSSGVVTSVSTDKSNNLVGVGESFSYMVDVKNTGEYDLQANDYIVKLLIPQDPGVFEGGTYGELTLNNENVASGTGLNPDGSTIPNGEFEIKTIPLKWASVTKPVDYDLSYRYCYKYETRADSILCKKSDLQGRISDDEKNTGCSYPEFGSSISQTTHNSNGPVQFSNLVQTIQNADSMRFTFDLSIIGGGNVGLADQGRDELTRCEWRPNDVTSDKVTVTIKSEAGLVECDNLKQSTHSTEGNLDVLVGIVEFNDESSTSKKISCKYKPENIGNAHDNLELKATYDYAKTETLSEQIKFLK